MKKKTTLLILVLLSFLGLQAQGITLPYLQNFSALTSGSMEGTGTSGTAASASDLTGFTGLVKGFQAGGVLKLGSSGDVGSLTTDVFTATGTSVRVAFWAVPWTGTSPKAAKVLVQYGSQSDTIDIAAATHTWPLTADDFTQYEVLFNSEATASSVTISTLSETGLDRRIFIDDLKISTLPMGAALSEGFEDAAFPPEGWVTYKLSGTVSWERYTLSTPIGAASASVNWASGGSNNWLITPKMWVSETAHTLSFQAKCPTLYSNTTLYIKVSTTGVSPTDFADTKLTLTDKVVMPNTLTTTWTAHTVDLSEYIGQNIYVAFHVVDNNGSRVMIDEITGPNVMPDVCARPATITASDITSNSATITWTDATGNSWIVENSSYADFSQDVRSYTVTDTTVQLTGLIPGRTQHVRVMADCGAGDFSSWEYTTFVTSCGTVDPYNWRETFDNYPSDNKKPNCWTRTLAYNSGTTTSYPNVTTTTAYCQDSEGGGMEMRATSSAPTNLIASPLFADSLSGSEVSFYVKYTISATSTSTTGDAYFGVMSDPADAATFIPVASIIPDERSAWVNYTLSLAAVPSTHKYIAFKLDRTEGTPYIYIDNIRVYKQPTCILPTDFTVADVSDSTAMISWRQPQSIGLTQWVVEYSENSSFATGVQTLTVTDSVANLTGLQDNTLYYIRIKADCGDEQSFWLNGSVRTNCGELDPAAWLESFEKYTSENSKPDCWTRAIPYNSGTTTSYPYVSTSSTAKQDEIGGGLYMYVTNTARRNLIVSNRFKDSISSSEITLWVKKSNANAADLIVGAMTDVEDTTSFYPIALINPSETGVFEKFYIQLDGIADTYRYIALDLTNQSTSTVTYYVDNIDMHLQPTCVIPTSLTVVADSILPGSLNVSWHSQNGGTEDAFEVAYRLYGTEDYTSMIVTDTMATITGLHFGKYYDVKVRALCDTVAGDISDWVENNTGVTDCGAVNIPWVYNFYDNDTLAQSGASCLRVLEGVYNSYPMITNYASNLDPNSYNMYFYTSIDRQTVALPEFADDLSGAWLKFWVLNSSSTYYGTSGSIIIGAMEDVLDSATYMPIEMISDIPRTWTQYTVPLTSVPNTHKYLTITLQRDTAVGSPDYYIDNLLVEMMPSCVAPTGITAANITANSADISWTIHSGEYQWVVEYKSIADTVWTPQTVLNDANTLLTNLTHSTEYDLRIKAVCDTASMSEYSTTIRFATLCDAVSSVYEDFNDVNTAISGNLPNCWSKNSTNDTYPSVVSSAASDGLTTPSVKFMSSKPQFLISPKIDRPLNQMMLSFGLNREGSSCGTFQVGVMSDPADTATYVPVADFDNNGVYKTLVTHTVVFDNVTDDGSNRYIAFRYGDVGSVTQPTYWYYWVDNVRIDTLPDCMTPTGISISGVTDTTATVSWSSHSGEQAWKVAYKDVTDTVWIEQTVQNDTSLIITGLTNTTSYEVKVKALCDSIDSSGYSLPVTFLTQCGPVSSVYENFDAVAVGQLPVCWSKNSTHATAPGVVDSDTYNGVPTKSVKFMSSKPQFLITPKFNRPLNELMLDFDLSREGGQSGIFQVGVMSDPMDTTTFIPVANFDNEGVTKTLISHTLTFGDIVDDGDNRFIAFRYGDVPGATVSTAWFYWIDNIVVDTIPSCMPPTVQIATLDATQADVVVVPYDSTTTQFDYVITNNIATTSPDGLAVVSVTSLQFTISGLQSNTEYKLWVRSNCGAADGLSAWTQPTTFRTPCGEVSQSIGYTENFDDVPTGDIPACWNRISSHATYPAVVGAETSNGLTTPSIKFMGSKPQYLVMQKMNAPLSSLYLKFSLVQEGAACGKFQVGIMSNPMNASTFVPIATIDNGGVYKQKIAHEFDFGQIVDDTTNRYIAFRYGDVTIDGITHTQQTGWYYWVDDVEIIAAPTCLRVGDISATNITTSSATVNFVSKPGQTAWQYLLVANASSLEPDSTDVGIDITADSINLTGLNANTPYTIWIRTVCDNNEYSSWSRGYTFRTACGVNTIPFFESFADRNAEDYNNAYCWTRVVDMSTSTTHYPYVYSSTSYSHDDIGSVMYFYLSSLNSLQMVASPEIANLNTAEVSFWLKDASYSSSSVGTMEFGTMSDLTDTTTYVAISDVTPTSRDTWVNYEFALNTIPAGHKYLVFKGALQTGYTTFYLDEVGVYPIPTCLAPTGLTVDPNTLTGSSAEVSWTARGQETSWVLYHKKNTSATWDSIAVNNYPMAVLTGLDPITTYEIKVKAICTTTDVSRETGVVTFRTLCGAETLPFIETFNGALFPPTECWMIANTKADDIFLGNSFSTTTTGWGRSTIAMPSGAAKLNIYGTSRNHWLITPLIDLNGIESAVLEFDVALTQYNQAGPPTGTFDDDKFIVAIGTNDGNTWVQANATVWSNDGLGDYMLNNIPNTPYRYTIDISQYVGQNIRIGFYGESTVYNGDNDLHIDSIVVKSIVVLPAQVTTLPATDIGDNTATLHKTVVEGSYSIDSEGYYYRQKNSADPRFTATTDDVITGLIPGTIYEYYAYATANNRTYYGDTLEFTTTGQAPVPPTVTTLAATDITQTTAKVHKTVVADTSEPVVSEGWKYALVGSSAWFDAPADGTLTGLHPDTTYQFYAYATTAINPSGYSGDILTFRTLAHIKPVVVTGAATNVTGATATLHKTVTAGSETIIAEGWKYRVETNPMFYDAPADGNLTSLVPNATYYFFAYVSTATFPMESGDTLSFTTLGTGLDLAESAISIYPNPAKDEVSIEVDGLTADATATIYDMVGKAVGKYIVSAATGKVTVDVSTMADGTYMVSIVSKDINRVERLIIKR